MTKIKGFISIVLVFLLLTLGIVSISRFYPVSKNDSFVLFSINNEEFSKSIESYSFKQGMVYDIKVFSNLNSRLSIKFFVNKEESFQYSVNGQGGYLFDNIKPNVCQVDSLPSGGFRLSNFKDLESVISSHYSSGAVFSDIPTDCSKNYYKLSIFDNEDEIVAFNFSIQINVSSVELNTDSIIFT